MVMKNSPLLILVTGPNGAGKSTLVLELFANNIFPSELPLVNPDIIAYEEQVTPVVAGREALRRREELLQQKKNFILETTFSGNSEMRLIHKAKAQGYQIMLHFVSLESKALSMARIKMRVAKGGHDIPVADVHRRFERCYANMHKAQPLADSFFLYDNSGLKRNTLLITREKVVHHKFECYEGRLKEYLSAY